MWPQHLILNALVFHCTSFITCRTAGVSGVYNSLPIKSGSIPRHTMRDSGLDSRPRIKLLQNGAAERKEKKNKNVEFWQEKAPKTKSQEALTSAIVTVQICVLGSVFSQKGLNVIVFVPVERWDALPTNVRVATHNLWKGTKAFAGHSSAVLRRQQSKSSTHLHEAGERGELEGAESFGGKHGKTGKVISDRPKEQKIKIKSSVSSHHQWGRPAPARLRLQPGWCSSGPQRSPSAALSDRKEAQTHIKHTREAKSSQIFLPLSDSSATVKSFLKSSWVRKRRSASSRRSTGRPHSWVWRAFMATSPPSTVRNCFNMLALHTKSFSCVWAPARAIWKGTRIFFF